MIRQARNYGATCDIVSGFVYPIALAKLSVDQAQADATHWARNYDATCVIVPGVVYLSALAV